MASPAPMSIDVDITCVPGHRRNGCSRRGRVQCCRWLVGRREGRGNGVPSANVWPVEGGGLLLTGTGERYCSEREGGRGGRGGRRE
ncbi:MAG: hypothetical protein MJE68_33155 [Proteobacteria bacterium]|nr:hypothetical protein [Pseudomonadota bacterium]